MSHISRHYLLLQDRITEALHVYEDYGSIGGHGLGDIELIEPSPPGFE